MPLAQDSSSSRADGKRISAVIERLRKAGAVVDRLTFNATITETG